MIKRKFKTLLNIIKYKLKEKHYKGAKYLLYKTGSDTLMICFQAMPPTNIRLYNNVKGFSNLPVDRLYISDSWGYRGSYYLYENGELQPFNSTKKLIEKIINDGKYKNIYTCGTSKGGSAAIIYGLLIGADYIFSGACQYYIGSYLNVPEHLPILQKMSIPKKEKEMVDTLNQVMPSIIRNPIKNKKTSIHLIYSRLEHTYEEHIQYLIADLIQNGFSVNLNEYGFKNHSEVGIYYLKYIQNWFDNINNERHISNNSL